MVVENTCFNNVTICVCLHELLNISNSSRVYCCKFAYGNQHGGRRINNVNHCQVCFFAGRGSTCCCLSDPYSSKNPNYCTAFEEANEFFFVWVFYSLLFNGTHYPVLMSIKQFDEGTTLNEVASRFIPGTPQDLRVSSSHSLMFMFTTSVTAKATSLKNEHLHRRDTKILTNTERRLLARRHTYGNDGSA